MNARHLSLITPTADSDRSDTYSVDYGRVTGIAHPATEDAADNDAAALTALADAVDAYRAVTRLARSQPGSARWRAACRTHHRASRTYAALSGLTMPEIAAKVRSISGCFTNA